jgi:alkylation response protein AidB-like acyl-CoA dehydrogenase
MDLTFTPEEEAFRDEVRAFLAANLPQRLSDKTRRGQHLTKAEHEEWHAILNSRGWFANHWPVDWGGPGWSVMQRFIFETETALAHAPRILPFGVSMIGPVLLKYGSEEQKRNGCRAFSTGATGGVRAIPSRARGRTLPGSRPARCAMAIIMSSTGRRRGPRWHSSPT